MKKILFVLFITIFLFLVFSHVGATSASLYLSPSEGNFFTGSTFTVSIYIDTEKNEINALQIGLKFDPKILQVISQTNGKSFVSEWLTPPNYSNTGGTINFKGGIPGGIKTSAGLISTVTFRAKAPGKTEITFLDTSKVFLNDGRGTPLEVIFSNGAYDISAVYPEGPKISSSTHPNLNVWYNNSSPIFSWEKEQEVDGFSFTLDQNVYGMPDDENEGIITQTSYEGLQSGIWYFHLKTKKNGMWGKTSDFLIRIDTQPPRDFNISFDQKNSLLSFSASDPLSGIDHYEIGVVDVTDPKTSLAPFFVEARSPYKIPFKKTGKFKILVRALDKAGNLSREEENLAISLPFLSFTDQNVLLGSIVVSKTLFYASGAGFLILIGFFLFRLFERRDLRKRLTKEIKEAEKEINDVKKLQKKIQNTGLLEVEIKKEEEKLVEKLLNKDSKD